MTCAAKNAVINKHHPRNILRDKNHNYIGPFNTNTAIKSQENTYRGCAHA